MNIVDACQAITGHLICFKKMMQIGAGIFLAHHTAARLINRLKRGAIGAIKYFYIAGAGKK